MQSCSTGRCIMKIIVEASAYLVILSFICLISLDFIAVNKSVSKGSEVQQYIKDVIQINGISYEHRDIDYDTNKKVCEIAAQYGADVSYEYYDAAADYDYYRLNIKYPVKSRLFGLPAQGEQLVGPRRHHRPLRPRYRNILRHRQAAVLPRVQPLL